MSCIDFEVQCGFGGGEETTRFGPRNESGSSLYQVDTVACVSSRNQVLGSPSIKVNACTQCNAVAIERNLLVFDDGFTEHLCTFNSGSLIDVSTWSENGHFLVYADRSGSISLCHVDSKQVLFAKELVEITENLKKPCFVSLQFLKQEDELCELFVITSEGMGFRFQNLDLENLHKAVTNKDLEEAQKIQSQIKMVTFEQNFHEEVTSAMFNSIDEETYFLLTGSGDFGISEWSLDGDEVLVTNIAQHLSPAVGFKKCLESSDGQYLITLDSQKYMSLWTRNSFIHLSSWEQQVEDFILFTTSTVESDKNGNSKSKEESKVVLLTTTNEKMKRQLMVVSLPRFELVYKLEVSCCTALATMPFHQDTIIFIEGVADLDDSVEEDDWPVSNISTIRVRCLMEAIPQNRFSRMLHKKKFADAEVFAKMFGLDVQLVHKVRSHDLLDKLSPWGTEDQSLEVEYEKLITELKECLDKIEDMEHVVNCCLHAQLPTLNATSELLNYARRKVNFGTRKFTKSSNLLQELLDGINRLVTFEVAYGSHLFSGASWCSFLTSPLLDEVIKSFRETKINSGIIIWRRHQSEFDSSFTVNKLGQILNSIPKVTPSNKLVPWLREDFVPYVLTICPDGQCVLADWLESTARRLEVSEKENWPDNALDLAEVMYTAFSNVSQSTQERGVASPMPFATKICKLSIPYFHYRENQNDVEESGVVDVNLSAAMLKLGNLVKNLREVKSLHHDYNCKLSLVQFTSEDTKAIAFKLLDRIAAAELIPQTMRKYVRPYVAKNNLKVDQVLFAYIQALVDVNNQLAVIWETKVIAIIKEIEKKEPRSEATLKLMLKAVRPWSAEVESLVAAEMKNNPDNVRLHRQYQFAQLCKMMAGYGIRDTNLADLSRIEAVLKQMFSTDNPNALNDALKICQYYSSLTTAYVYSMRIKFWIDSGKLIECCELIKNIPLSEVVKISDNILVWIGNVISWQPVDDEDRSSQRQTTEAVLLLLQTVSKLDKMFGNDKKAIVKKLKNISRLQCEFGIFISLTRYNDEDERRNLVKQYHQNPAVFTNPSERTNYKPCKKQNKMNRLVRFAELLEFSTVELDDIIVDILCEDNNLQEIFEVARKMMKSMKDDKFLQVNCKQMKLIWKILHLLMNLNMDEELKFDWVKHVDDLHAFASVLLSLCHEDKIIDYQMLAKLLRMIANIGAQCESTDYEEDNKKSDGLLQQWIEDQYHDDSLVLSSTDVFPLVQKLFSLEISSGSCEDLAKYNSSCLTGRGVSFHVNSQGSCDLDTVEFSKVLQMLVKIFQENNQQQLTMQAVMLGISTCVQHSANLKVGIPVVYEVISEDEKNELRFMEAELKTAEMILAKGETIIKDNSSKLARTVLCHRVIDGDMALCYLNVLSLEDGEKIITSLKQKFMSKYTRIQTIAKVGANFAVLRSNSQFQHECKILSEGAYWGRKLQLLRVSVPSNITYNLHGNKETIKTALSALVQHPKIDLQSISLYCESFAFDEETAILGYIESQLIPPNKFTISTNIEYQDRIDEAIHALSPNFSKLKMKLMEAVLKISPFDYDRLTFLFKKLVDVADNKTKKVSEENLQLLEMLAMYERTSDVDVKSEDNILDNTDEELWSNESHGFPEEAKKRLPLHPLLATPIKHQVLTAEMTSEQNVFKLKPIFTKLKLDKDQLFAVAIQNIAKRELQLMKSHPGKIFDFSLVENIFNEIDDHVIMMSVAKWLAKQLPKGAEKAMVLRKLVVRIEKTLSDNAGVPDNEAIINLKQTYPRIMELWKYVSVQSFLMEYGITEDRFFVLCKDPSALIIKLYEEYGDKATFETGRFTGVPDVNSIAQKIAEIHQLSLAKIVKHMLLTWLPYKRGLSGHDDDDEDVDRLSFKANKDDVIKENEKNLRRAIYTMASAFDKGMVLSLITAVYQSEDITNMCRIRAIQILFTLVDSAYIKQVSGREMSEINEKLVSCIYLSELERLHITHSEETFSKCNKEGLVKGLWRNHSHEPEGVRLIADICLDYKIYDPQLWNSLLLKLLSFDMVPYLTHVLVLLSGVSVLREIPSLVKMWKTVITTPFNSVSSPMSKEDERSCLQASQLLTRCPVILDIGLPEIASLMKTAGLYSKAMYCLKLIPDRKQREESIQNFLDDVGIEPILSVVKKSRDQGMMDPHLDGVEEEVFNYVHQHNLYISLHGTTYFDRLVGFLVRTRKLNNLLVRTIAAGRLTNAVELVALYLSEHSNTSIAKIVNDSEMDPRNALMVYLQQENLLSSVKPYLSNLLKTDTTLNNSSLTTPIFASTFNGTEE